MNKKAFFLLFLNIHVFSHACLFEDPVDEHKKNPPSALAPLFYKEGYLNSISTLTVSYLSPIDQANLGSVSKDICDMVNLLRVNTSIQALVHIGFNAPHIQRLFQENVYQGWKVRCELKDDNRTQYYDRQFSFLKALREATHYNIPLVAFLTTSTNTLIPLECILPIETIPQTMDFKSISGKSRYSNDLLKEQHLYHFNRFKEIFSLFSGYLREADTKHLICQQMDFLLSFDPDLLKKRLEEVSQHKDILLPSDMPFETKKSVIRSCLRAPIQDVLMRLHNMRDIMFTIFPRGLMDWEETAWMNIYVTLTKDEFRTRLQAFRDFGSAFFSQSSMFIERKIINQQDRASIITVCLALPPKKTQLLSENASIFFPRKTHSIHDRPSLLFALSHLSEQQIMALVAHADNFSFLAIDTHDLIDCLEDLKDLSVKQLNAVGLYARIFFPVKMNLMNRINQIKLLKNYTPTQIMALGAFSKKNLLKESKRHSL